MGQQVCRSIRIRGIPAVFLVKDNEVIATGVRGSLLEQKLEELLK